jgi:hypothetical protein
MADDDVVWHWQRRQRRPELVTGRTLLSNALEVKPPSAIRHAPPTSSFQSHFQDFGLVRFPSSTDIFRIQEMVGGKRKMKTEMELASLSPTISQLRIGHARTGSQNQKIHSATPELLLALRGAP